MALFDIKTDGNIAVLTMNSGENRFNLAFCKGYLSALDEIENNKNINTLVVTSAHEKIWSNGLDLEWLMPAIARNDPEVQQFVEAEDEVMKRIQFFPMLTIGAITGHAFAAGAILACCFDFRFIRSDRGYFCLPEVDLNIPILGYQVAIVRKALPMRMVEEAMFTGKRFTGLECESSGFVRKACPPDQVVNEAVAFAKTLNKGREIVSIMKKTLYADITYLTEHIERHKLDPNNVPIK